MDADPRPPGLCGPATRMWQRRAVHPHSLHILSNAHGHHRSVPLPPCDALIHGGDFTNYGEPDMTADVSEYFSKLRYNVTARDEIICIASNHELTFEPEHYDKVWRQFKRPKQDGKYDIIS